VRPAPCGGRHAQIGWRALAGVARAAALGIRCISTPRLDTAVVRTRGCGTGCGPGDTMYHFSARVIRTISGARTGQYDAGCGPGDTMYHHARACSGRGSRRDTSGPHQVAGQVTRGLPADPCLSTQESKDMGLRPDERSAELRLGGGEHSSPCG